MAVLGMVPLAAHAANKAFDTSGNTNGNFSGANWLAATTPTAGGTLSATSGDSLYFGQATTTTLTNDLTGATFGGITFNSNANSGGSATSSFTIGGNSFTLNGAVNNYSTVNETIGNAIVLNGNENISTNSGTTLTLSGNISGAYGLYLYPTSNNYSSHILLSGNNTYTGATTVGYATVEIGSATALGTGTLGTNNNGHFDNATGSNSLTLANALSYTGSGGMYFDGTNSMTFNGNNTLGGQLTTDALGTNSSTLTLAGTTTFANSTTLTVNNSGSLILGGTVNYGAYEQQSGGSGTLVLNSANTGAGASVSIGGLTYTATLRANSGIVQLNNAAALSTGVLDLRSATLQAGTALTGANKITNTIVNATGTPTIGGTNNIELGGAYIVSNAVSAPALNITNTGTTTISGPVSLTDGSNNHTLTVDVAPTAGTTLISGVIQNATTSNAAVGSFAKTDSGPLTLSGASTYTGSTNVQNGTLQLTGSLSSSTALNLGSGTNSGLFVLGGSSGAVNQTVSNLTTAGTGTSNAVVGGSSAISTLTVNSSANGTFTGTLGGSGTNQNNLAFTKAGTGALTLAGSSTYSGPTTVNGGSLIAGSLANSAVTVNSGTFNGSGSAPSINVAAGSSNTVANGGGTAASLTTGSLTFNGAGALSFTSSAATENSPAINVNGALTTTGPNSLSVSFASTDKVLASGTYDLLNYGSLAGSGFSALPSTVTVSGLSNRQTDSLTNISKGGSNGEIALVISGTNPVWTGALNSNWDTSTNNFVLQGTTTPTAFESGDIDTFDNTAVNKIVNIDAGNVNPTIVYFNGGNYTINGPYGIVDGPNGATPVNIASGASVALASPNGYSGGTNLTDGSLSINNATALGTGPLNINSTGLATLDNTSGAAVTLTTNNAQAWNTDFTFVGTNSLNLGTGAVSMSASRNITVNANTLTVGGAISGTGYSLTKLGAGTLALGGSNTYTGGTNVNNGELDFIGGTSNNTAGSINVGITAGFASATLGITGSSTVVNTSGLSVGGSGGLDANYNDLNATPGTVNQTGGTLNVSSYMLLGPGSTADGTSIPSATYNLSGGTLNMTGNGARIEMSNGLAANSTLNISGTGALNLYNSETIVLGRYTATGNATINQTGGTVTFYSNAGTTVGGTGYINLGLDPAGGYSSNGVYTYNLNGGTLTVPYIESTGSAASGGTDDSELNLNGGILKAAAACTNFIQNLTAANVRSGGAIIDDGGYAVTIQQPLVDGGGGGGLTKQGAGTLTLTATNTYTGGTTITNGTLQIGASLSTGAPITGSINSSSGITINGTAARLLNNGTTVSPAVTLTSGKVDGTGTYNSVNVANNAANVVTHGNGTTAQLAINNLTFLGAGQLSFNLAGNSGPGITTTNVAANGSADSVLVDASNSSSWANGQTYDLLRYSGSLTGFNAFGVGTITGLGVRQTATLTNPAGYIALQIIGDTPVWTGAYNGNWTTATLPSPKNWQLQTAGTPTDFLPTDQVIFDDTATGTTNVVISDANVNPTSVTFNNSSKNYSISGSYGIASGLIVKNGTGTVTMGTSNTYTGSTTINAGAYNVQNAGGLGNSSGVTVNSGGTLQLQGGISTTNAVPLTINGTGLTASPAGALENVSGSNTYTGLLALGSAATIGADTGSTLTLSNTGTIKGSGNNLTLVGAGTGNIASIIGTVSGSLTDNSTGTWTLTGHSTFTGGTTVNSGILVLGVGGGAGTLSGPLTINNGATVRTNAGDAVGYTAGTALTTVTVNTGGVFDDYTGGNQGYITNFLLNGGTVQSTSGGRINFSQGYGISTTASNATSAFSAPITIRGDSIAYTIASGSTLTDSGSISGGDQGVFISGPGTVVFSGANTYGGGTFVNSGKLILGNAGAVANGALTVSAGASGALTPALTQPVKVSALTLASTAKFDVSTSVLDLIGGNTDVNVRSWIASGYASGAQSGFGIISSAAAGSNVYGVGYADGSDGVVSGLAAGTIQIEEAYLGDSNLDGKVDGVDLDILASHFGSETGTSNWDQGDFSYDGNVDGVDLDILASHFGDGTGMSSSLAATTLQADLLQAEAEYPSFGAYVSVNGVPEPTTASMLVIGAGMLLGRRRRRHQ